MARVPQKFIMLRATTGEALSLALFRGGRASAVASSASSAVGDVSSAAPSAPRRYMGAVKFPLQPYSKTAIKARRELAALIC